MNWTPEGLIGELFRITAGYLPTLPDDASPPPLRGDEEHVRELFDDARVQLQLTRATTPGASTCPSTGWRS